MKHEIEDGEYLASIYYNPTPAEFCFNTPLPIFQSREKGRVSFTHKQAQSWPFIQVGCTVCIPKIPALLQTSSPTRNQKQKSLVEKFQPAQVSVPNPEFNYPVWDR